MMAPLMGKFQLAKHYAQTVVMINVGGVLHQQDALSNLPIYVQWHL